MRTRAIDDEIVSVPSGRFVAVDVDQQHHPVAVGRRGQFVGGFDVEVDVVGVACHFRSDDVVTARIIFINVSSVSFVPPVHRIAFVRCEVGSHVVPSVGPADPNRFWGGIFFLPVHSFEFSDVVDQLQVIYVSFVAPSGVRLDIAAAIPVVLIGESHIIRPVGRPIGDPAGDVFVPSGDEHQFRVELKRAVPLLLEIPSVQIAVHARVESFQHTEIPPESFRLVERAKTASAGETGVLGHSDGHFFVTSFR